MVEVRIAKGFDMNKILLLILCGLAFAQTEKPKAAVYIKGNPEGREALKMAVNIFLIKSQKYQMIAVDAIDVVAKEQNRQNSGSVSNEDIALLGRDAGAKYVCVVERAEFEGRSYVTTSMVSVESKIAELSEMSELPRGERIISLIEKQINTMLGIALPPEPEPEPEYTPPAKAEYSPPIEHSYSANLDLEPNVPTEIDNGLGKSKVESKKSIWPGVVVTLVGAGFIYSGVLFKKEGNKNYNKYSSLSGASEKEYSDAYDQVMQADATSISCFFFGGIFSLIGIPLIFGGI